MSQAVLLNDPTAFVDGILLCNVHRCQDCLWKTIEFAKWDDKTVSMLDILLDKLPEELGTFVGTFVIAKNESFFKICCFTHVIELS